MRWVSILVSWCAVIGIGGAQETRLQAASDADQAARLLRAELELVGARLGSAAEEAPAFTLANLSVREVYLQALLVSARADRLHHERTQRKSAPLPKAVRNPRAVDVHLHVEGALRAVRGVKGVLGIEEAAQPARGARAPGLAGTYADLARSHRILNRLVREKAKPAELHERISQAVAYAMRICLASPGERIPREPETDPARGESDLFAVMMECARLQEKIAANLNVEIAQIEASALRQPSGADLEELAALLLAGMQRMHEQVATRGAVLQAVAPRECAESRVVRRSILLRRYLKRISKLAQNTAQGAN